MCRHLAWLGPPATLDALVSGPPFSLARQAWAPRRQAHGTMNVDGFGVGWYVGSRPEPVRYRRAQPLWSDVSFASLAPTISTGCLVAAVRSASEGTAPDESCAAPFTHGRRLFSHNGRLADRPRARREFEASTADVPEAAAAVDSALLFGLAAAAWEDGAGLAAGLCEAVARVAGAGGGRLTCVAADGERIAAVTWAEPMYVVRRDGGVLLASEPSDDGDDWERLDDARAVEVSADGVDRRALNAW